MLIPILDGVFKVLDKIIPDPQAREKAKLDLITLQQNGEFKELEKRYEAITAEAKSTDPFTSRARPSFMYVFYIILLVLTCVAPALGLINPDAMQQFFLNVGLGFKAIPEELWWTFSVGFLGYSASRTYEKAKGVAK